MVNSYADIILADVYILNPKYIFQGLVSIAIKDQKIYAIDDFKKLKFAINAHTKIIKLSHHFVLPAFWDAHIHLIDLGLSKLFLNLSTVKNISEIAQLIRNYIQQSKHSLGWIIGYGWNQNDWKDHDPYVFPTHQVLSNICNDIPICLKRIDEHCIWVNEYAMRLAGINEYTPDPPGGKILRDEKGIPTGIFLDSAMNLIYKHIPSLTYSQKLEALTLAQNELFSYGIVAVNDALLNNDDIEFYEKAYANNKIDLRIYGMFNGSNKECVDVFLQNGPIINKYNKFNVRTIKLFVDGALGSRGAALIKPYNDDSLNKGILILDEQQIYEISKKALHHKFQIAAHAIGDRANHVVAKAFSRVFKQCSNIDHRFRVEHVQIINKADIDKLAKYNIIASVQPVHFATDYEWAIKRLGKNRIQKAYLWNTLKKRGVKIILGTDAPIASVNPFLNLNIAITRKYFKENKLYRSLENSKEKLNIKDALKAMSLNVAYANFQEHICGTIEVGKYADLIVISKNILNIPKKDICNIKPLITISQGKVVFNSSSIFLD